MEHLFQEEFQKSYDQGYTFGLNPIFANCEDLGKIAPNQRNEAFVRGFEIGRDEYEQLNGKVCDGIPAVILTEKILLGYRIDAQLGIPLEALNFTPNQMMVIRKHYACGAKRYDWLQHLCLYRVLEQNRISVLPHACD